MMNWQQETARILAEMGEPGVEILDHTEGTYLSIPIGYRAALELEEEAEERTIFISQREWDQTNGLHTDELLAQITYREPRMLARITKAMLDEYEEIERAAQAEIDAAYNCG